MLYYWGMKECTRCNELLPLEEFNKKGSYRLQAQCKSCQREYQRTKYHENREDNAEKQRLAKKIRMDAIKADIRKLKEETPCTDCKLFFKWYQIDFDHISGKKTTHVSEMVRQGSARWRIFSEIAKCEIVCANCHRERTFTRGQHDELDLE
jgi:DNA-directed RNA polymerase subunit M/transcription elongation factor TFIIS